MHHCKKNSLAILLLLFVALSANGQIASSPFSAFGVGDLYNSNANVQNQSMGGIGISNTSPWYINGVNPALLVFNRVTVFQGGMQFEKKTLTDGLTNQSFQNGNLSYLNLAFPVKSGKWTTGVGLTPLTNVNYNITYQENANGSFQPITYKQTGKGGVNQFYWSNGVALTKYLSLGVRASYQFGNIVTQNASQNVGAFANTSVKVTDSFNGLNLTGGISFHKDSLFKKNFRVNVGAIYNTTTTFPAQHKLEYQSIASNGAVIDTYTNSDLDGKLHIPESWGVGVSFGKVDRWTLGWDYTYLDYRKFSYRTNDQTAQFNGIPTIGYRSGVGLEFIPQPEDFTNYLNRVMYRVGASYEKSTMLINGNPMTDIGGTFGFSLPVSRFSTIDLGIKIGKRGIVKENLLQENYFRVFFGITFNDNQWFIKRKFE
ncbi:membrane protein [Cytophagales bacterium WSM2-2]|nr:membrane protein [Cytophagales bacterium WSM2-2]